jgi:cobaltochelatase CobN
VSRRGWLAAVMVLTALVSGQAQQNPARIAFIYEGGESVGPAEIRRAVRPLADGVSLSVFAPGKDGDTLSDALDLSSFDVVFVDGGMAGFAGLRDRVLAASRATRVVVVRPPSGVAGSVSLTEHPWLPQYWADPSQDNYLGLTRYLVARVLGRSGLGEVLPPVSYPEQAFYHPDAPALFATLDQYLAWSAARPKHRYNSSQLSIGLTVHRTSVLQRNVAPTDALIREIEARGHNALALATNAGPDLTAHFIRAGRTMIDTLLLNLDQLDRVDRAAGLARARALGVPILSSLNQNALTRDQFRDSPNGLFPGLVPSVVGGERDGVIEPMVVSAKGAARGDSFFTEPIDAQVRWRVTRAESWARLRRAGHPNKRVVMTFYSPGGKASVGADPDDFLDVPASAVRLLTQMKAAGYDIGPGPIPSAEDLGRRLALNASNVGTWAGPEVVSRVKSGDVVLLPEADYLAWFNQLPQRGRDHIVEMWGPPPGEVMVYTDAKGARFLVLPRVQFGKVLLAAHPDWGYLQSQKALMSTTALPPHHQYLAFFLWMQKGFKADAWVSLFSNIVLQPGKAEAPAAEDLIAQMLGPTPHIHPERLGAGGGVSQRRKGMAQTVSWYNLVAQSDNTEHLFELRARLSRYDGQADAALRKAAEPLIVDEIKQTGLDRALGAAIMAGPFETLRTETIAYLESLEKANGPNGSKVLGDAPTGTALASMVAAMLGADFRALLTAAPDGAKAAALRLIQATIVDGQSDESAMTAILGRADTKVATHLTKAREFAALLAEAPREVDGVMAALSGRWIEPGLGEDPIRRPISLPPGRSLYNFDQATLPTAEAEAVGIGQAEALIAQHREKHGAYPTKLAFVIFSSGIANNHGVTEAQILHLLGTRAVRNERGEVTGVALIPREELGRPRVDILATTAGTYRDHYPDQLELMSQAVHLAAASPEADNPVAAATREIEAQLRSSGETADRAGVLARARIYSPAPGAYSPSIQFLAKAGDQRGDEARMAELFTGRMSHAYGSGLYGQPARAAYEQNLAKTDAATIARSSTVNALLDNPMPAGFLGGMNMAAKAVTGRDIDLYVNDLRDTARATIEPAARALQTELRTRYFNRAWLQSMQAHGYDGARNMMLMTDHLDLWDSTATRTVSSEDWGEVKSVYVDDRLKLGMDAFFERHNPHAQQVMLANLLGAAGRGHWMATPAELSQVASRLAKSMIDHGAVCEASICRNPALTAAVASALESAPDGAALAAGYAAAVDRSTRMLEAGTAPSMTAPTAVPPAAAASAAAAVPAPSAAAQVTGKVMETVGGSPAAPITSMSLTLVGAVGLTLLLAGWWRGGRT